LYSKNILIEIKADRYFTKNMFGKIYFKHKSVNSFFSVSIDVLPQQAFCESVCIRDSTSPTSRLTF